MSRHALVLALRYLAAAPGQTAVLIMGIAIALFLPSFTIGAGQLAEGRLLARAEHTPIVLGHEGNEFDLVMSALYFRGQVRDPIPHSAIAGVTEAEYGLALPLHVGHSAGGAPLVGTSLDYFEVRGLRRILVPVPVLTPRLSSYWVHWTTSVSARVARPLIDGLRIQQPDTVQLTAIHQHLTEAGVVAHAGGQSAAAGE